MSPIKTREMFSRCTTRDKTKIPWLLTKGDVTNWTTAHFWFWIVSLSNNFHQNYFHFPLVQAKVLLLFYFISSSQNLNLILCNLNLCSFNLKLGYKNCSWTEWICAVAAHLGCWVQTLKWRCARCKKRLTACKMSISPPPPRFIWLCYRIFHENLWDFRKIS